MEEGAGAAAATGEEPLEAAGSDNDKGGLFERSIRFEDGTTLVASTRGVLDEVMKEVVYDRWGKDLENDHIPMRLWIKPAFSDALKRAERKAIAVSAGKGSATGDKEAEGGGATGVSTPPAGKGSATNAWKPRPVVSTP